MRSIVSFLAVLLLVSCSPKVRYSDTPQKTVIIGKVENVGINQRIPTLMTWLYGINLGKQSNDLDENGEFRFEYELYYPTDIRINAGGTLFSVIAHPGDSIHVTIDTNRNLTFSGNRSATNQAVAKYENAIRRPFSEHWDMQESVLKQKNAEKYKSFVDSIYQVQYSFAESFVAEEKPNAEATKWILAQSREMYQELLQEYAFAYGLESTPDYYYKSLEKYFPATEEDLLNGYLVERLRAVYTFLGLRSKIQNDIQENREHVVLQKIVESVSNDFLRQMILINTVNQGYFENGNIEIYSNNQAFFEKHISVPFLRKFLQEKYSETKQKLSILPEELSSEMLKRLENSSADSIMKTILETNKGSVIYIDFWGTWCGPCLDAMRKSEPFIKRLKNDVAFVYLCLDSEKDSWEKTSKVMGIGEHNYFLNARQSSEMRIAFEIQGIPFYMLIDKNGTIVNKGNSLRIYDSTVFNKIVEMTKQ